MNKPPTEYPLCWPPGIERTAKPGTAAFRTSLAVARENVFTSLRLFGVDSGHNVGEVILSSNVSGLSGRSPSDAGVSVWFVWDGDFRCVAVDRYAKVEWNLQAIHHVIEAERSKLRHGGLQIVRATFRAYMALTGPATKRPWRDVLGVIDHPSVTPGVVREAWKMMAKTHHPDRGGDPAKMAAINAARDEGLRELDAD